MFDLDYGLINTNQYDKQEEFNYMFTPLAMESANNYIANKILMEQHHEYIEPGNTFEEFAPKMAPETGLLYDWTNGGKKYGVDEHYVEAELIDENKQPNQEQIISFAEELERDQANRYIEDQMAPNSEINDKEYMLTQDELRYISAPKDGQYIVANKHDNSRYTYNHSRTNHHAAIKSHSTDEYASEDNNMKKNSVHFHNGSHAPRNNMRISAHNDLKSHISVENTGHLPVNHNKEFNNHVTDQSNKSSILNKQILSSSRQQFQKMDEQDQEFHDHIGVESDHKKINNQSNIYHHNLHDQPHKSNIDQIYSNTQNPSRAFRHQEPDMILQNDQVNVSYQESVIHDSHVDPHSNQNNINDKEFSHDEPINQHHIRHKYAKNDVKDMVSDQEFQHAEYDQKNIMASNHAQIKSDQEFSHKAQNHVQDNHIGTQYALYHANQYNDPLYIDGKKTLDPHDLTQYNNNYLHRQQDQANKSHIESMNRNHAAQNHMMHTEHTLNDPQLLQEHQSEPIEFARKSDKYLDQIHHQNINNVENNDSKSLVRNHILHQISQHNDQQHASQIMMDKESGHIKSDKQAKVHFTDNDTEFTDNIRSMDDHQYILSQNHQKNMHADNRIKHEHDQNKQTNALSARKYNDSQNDAQIYRQQYMEQHLQPQSEIGYNNSEEENNISSIYNSINDLGPIHSGNYGTIYRREMDRQIDDESARNRSQDNIFARNCIGNGHVSSYTLPNSGHKISFKELQQQDYVMQNV